MLVGSTGPDASQAGSGERPPCSTCPMTGGRCQPAKAQPVRAETRQTPTSSKARAGTSPGPVLPRLGRGGQRLGGAATEAERCCRGLWPERPGPPSRGHHPQALQRLSPKEPPCGQSWRAAEDRARVESGDYTEEVGGSRDARGQQGLEASGWTSPGSCPHTAPGVSQEDSRGCSHGLGDSGDLPRLLLVLGIEARPPPLSHSLPLLYFEAGSPRCRGWPPTCSPPASASGWDHRRVPLV